MQTFDIHYTAKAAKERNVSLCWTFLWDPVFLYLPASLAAKALHEILSGLPHFISRWNQGRLLVVWNLLQCQGVSASVEKLNLMKSK